VLQVEAIHVSCDKFRKLAVLGGTGDQGSALALRWALAGHQVTLGSRLAERACKVADQLNKQHDGAKLQGAGNRDAASAADVVILTVPFSAQSATVEEVREVLDGKILIDVTVSPLPQDWDWNEEASEQILYPIEYMSEQIIEAIKFYYIK